MLILMSGFKWQLEGLQGICVMFVRILESFIAASRGIGNGSLVGPKTSNNAVMLTNNSFGVILEPIMERF